MKDIAFKNTENATKQGNLEDFFKFLHGELSKPELFNAWFRIVGLHGAGPLEHSVDSLKGELSPEQQAEVENLLAEDPMSADALEGLQKMKNPEQLAEFVPSIQNKTQKLLTINLLT